MPIVNLGILAHVDAGKTSLTEHLLFNAGLINGIGKVDNGDTQTDSLELERRRGITIQSAVVALKVGDTQVNLIDTPGHSDFAGEIERALRVLDGAVLVVSAVEGVQAHTRILMRLLTSLRIPVLIFVNKIDRVGARCQGLLKSIAEVLTPRYLPMSRVEGLGSREATSLPLPSEHFTEVLAEHSDLFLSAFVDQGIRLTEEQRTAELARQTRLGLVHPVYFGSAVTGVGVDQLVRDIQQLLPRADDDTDNLRATIFKIERGRAGEKICYTRVHSGVIRPRESVAFHRADPHGERLEAHGRVSAVRVFDRGMELREQPAGPGSIAKLWGLSEVRIGDQLGIADGLATGGLVTPPTLETVISPVAPQERPALFTALSRLAEEDPLIDLRHDQASGDIWIRLFGEVQKEVIAATLAEQFGLSVTFAPSRIVYVERISGAGEAVEEINSDGPNFFWATVGLRIEPAPEGSGLVFGLAVELGSLPLAFHKAIEETVRQTLRHGPHGWAVMDAKVTVTRTGYASPISAAGDFRNATPLVVGTALTKAGTKVHEPVHRFAIEAPADCAGAVITALAAERGITDQHTMRSATTAVLEGRIPAGSVPALTQQLPELTCGEGVLISEFDGYQPYPGRPPVNEIVGANPYNREQYMLHTLGRHRGQ